MNQRRTQFLQTLGPGILLALSATGTSHLVQSTRAGAYYGFALLGFIVLANIMKYPFIEYGSRYASATGKSILDGYLQKSKSVLYLYILINIATMFTVNGAVTFVTAGLLTNLLGINLPANYIAAIIFAVCLIILAIGKYGILDSSLKLVGAVLVITTLASVCIALWHGPVVKENHFIRPKLLESGSILFIIALMGWMPTAIELSPWNSLWTLARIKQTGYRPTLKQSLFEFNLGYWSSATLAVAFMVLGAFIIYGSGEILPDSAVGFTAGIISIYTKTLGAWSYWIIAIAAFCTMFSTSITVLDGFSRSTQEAFHLLLPHKKINTHGYYILMMFIVATGAYLLISTFIGSFSALIDLATSVSFLAAPFMAGINFLVVMEPSFPQFAKPKAWMRWLSWLSIFFLLLFSMLYIVIKFS